jgi:hypothetical protein
MYRRILIIVTATIVIGVFIVFCGFTGFLLLEAELLAREHLPRIQQAVNEQCSQKIDVRRENIKIDEGITWNDKLADGREVSCRYSGATNRWICSC